MDDPREDQQPEADEGTQEFVEEVESDPTAPPTLGATNSMLAFAF